MKTTRGVFLNVKDSDYIVKIYGYEFYFSSAFYMNKFCKMYDDFIHTESLKFSQKYKVSINFAWILLLSLYKKIEKRGFYVKFNGKEISKDVVFFGEIWK